MNEATTTLTRAEGDMRTPHLDWPIEICGSISTALVGITVVSQVHIRRRPAR